MPTGTTRKKAKKRLQRSDLKRAWASTMSHLSNPQHEHVPITQLRSMCASRSAQRRLMALLTMRRQVYRDRGTIGYMHLARKMIDDSDNNCRWQALIVVGEFIETHPDDVWPLVEHYGQFGDEDMKAGVACVLLEHLLEHHRRRFRPRAERLASKSPKFKRVLDMCWPYN